MPTHSAGTTDLAAQRRSAKPRAPERAGKPGRIVCRWPTASALSFPTSSVRSSTWAKSPGLPGLTHGAQRPAATSGPVGSPGEGADAASAWGRLCACEPARPVQGVGCPPTLSDLPAAPGAARADGVRRETGRGQGGPHAAGPASQKTRKRQLAPRSPAQHPGARGGGGGALPRKRAPPRPRGSDLGLL